MPASAALLAFTNAVQSASCGQPSVTPEAASRIEATRLRLVNEIGEAATQEAGATIAAFNGLVRVADGTGIQLDEGMFAVSAADREALGLNDFGGAANSTNVAANPDAQRTEVHTLFG